MPDQPSLYLCWTTTSTREQAEQLSRGAVERGLAACAQIDGPITSVYTWKESAQCDSEYRILFKAIAATVDALEEFTHQQHPYDTPEWVCVPAEKVSEKYLKWAKEASNLRGFP